MVEFIEEDLLRAATTGRFVVGDATFVVLMVEGILAAAATEGLAASAAEGDILGDATDLPPELAVSIDFGRFFRR